MSTTSKHAQQDTGSEEQRSAHLARIAATLTERLPAEELALAESFTQLLWSKTAIDEIAERLALDDAALTAACWRVFRRRDNSATGIDIWNPDAARDGWTSPFSVVQIVLPDRPFVVDSVLMALSQDNQVTHHFINLVFATERDGDGRLTSLSRDRSQPTQELIVLAEIDRLDPSEHDTLRTRLERTLSDVDAAVADFPAMRERLNTCRTELSPDAVGNDELAEADAFLSWLLEDNFTFLGYREFSYGDGIVQQAKTPSLGVLRNRPAATPRPLTEQSKETVEFLLGRTLLSFSKAGTRSRVHRPAYPDYIGIKTFDEHGDVVGEHGFLGLYTSPVYRQDPAEIPVLRHKITEVRRRSTLNPAGFDGKTLAHVLTTWPRDELLQTDTDTLLEQVLAVTYIHERRRVRVFVRFDAYGLFATALVYLPKDQFNTSVRERLIELLADRFNAVDVEFEPTFSESLLVRIQFILRLTPGERPVVDVDELTHRAREIARDWQAELRAAALPTLGTQRGRHLANAYARRLPSAYRERYTPAQAVRDIADLERVTAAEPLAVQLYGPGTDAEPTANLTLKLVQHGALSPISDVMPIVENMGFRVQAVQPFSLVREDGDPVSLREFELIAPKSVAPEVLRTRLADALAAIDAGLCDDDRFNRLIVTTALGWREVSMLRSYARYMKQIRFGFSQLFISDALVNQGVVAEALTTLFHSRFDPVGGDDELAAATVLAALDDVASLNEDRVLRRLLDLMLATLRTNYYQGDAETGPPTLAFKLDGHAVPDLPKPAPFAEIFVCSPRLEGVHLRGGPVARGGLRWSDRLEDYRTEVLGLVKAQIVKNAVIVPTGAKGGFVPKRDSDDPRAEGLACYRAFISALLDVTDNLDGSSVLPPDLVRRHDGDDPYLVVAADKGTATFSDEANAIAQARNFWLGDAFASGGSNGYDHKKMGITARGAWVSVQRHFAERGVDVQVDPISVVGIGDMGGDVFGNGMLCSEAIELVAAFNHLHIILDPNPDAEATWAERKRLFELPRSTWADFNTSLLSSGGGVYERSAKSITVSAEAVERFDLPTDTLSPDQLINALLKAPIDLIWNGGIGTYVRATKESDDDVGDRANDSLRVTAAELRAKAFGEGGNLGMTQAARVEFGLAGGSVNSDFVDNAAGVDCSDHEVNIKIALGSAIARGALTGEERNDFLASMTDEVAELVLANNADQVRTLSLAERHCSDHLAEYQRLTARLERDSGLSRELEGLPSDEESTERASRGAALTRPELAVLQAYCKTLIKDALSAADLTDDPTARELLRKPFPTPLRQRLDADIGAHRLAGSIIATQAANDLIATAGISFVNHMSEFVGGSVLDIVRAYWAALAIFEVREQLAQLHQTAAPEASRLDAQLQIIRLVRRASRWLLRYRADRLDAGALREEFARSAGVLVERPQLLLDTRARDRRSRAERTLSNAGLEADVARFAANAAELAACLPLQDAVSRANVELDAVVTALPKVSERLELNWLAGELREFSVSSHWQSMERESLLDDVLNVQCRLATAVVRDAGGRVDAWIAQNPRATATWLDVVQSAQSSGQGDFALYAIICRKLAGLTTD